MGWLMLLMLAAPLGYITAALTTPAMPGSTIPTGPQVVILIAIGLPAALMQVKFGRQTVSNRLSQEIISQARPHGGPVQLKIPIA